MNPARRGIGCDPFPRSPSLSLKVISWPSHPASQCYGSTRIAPLYVDVRIIETSTVYTNVGHLSPANLDDDGNGAGLDTVWTFSYSSRFRKLS